MRYANGSLLEKLLPVVDNFELGLMEARRTSGEGSAVLVGMAMVQKQLEGFLTRERHDGDRRHGAEVRS